MIGAMELEMLRYSVVVNASGEVLSLKSLLTSLTVLSYDFLRKLRYSFSYLEQYSFIVSKVV